MRKMIDGIRKRIKSKKNYDDKEYISYEDYSYFMEQVNRWLLETSIKEERLILLDFLIDVVCLWQTNNVGFGI